VCSSDLSIRLPTGRFQLTLAVRASPHNRSEAAIR
jgi:hypothetical protein